MRSGHGGDIYRNRVTYDFSINVNPFGMPKSCREAIVASLDMASCYPDCEMEELRAKLAEKELGELCAERVIIGNGASELILGTCQLMQLEKMQQAGNQKAGFVPLQVLLTAPGFAEYESAALACGGEVCHLPLSKEKDFVLEEEAILSALTPEMDLLFLCNPNNPTGQPIAKELLKKIAAKCEAQNIRFCLDECFLPFMDSEKEATLKDLLDEYPHLLILRAFTKIFGMAGIRMGYLLSADTAFLERLRASLQPWNVSIPAQAASMAALEEEKYIRKTQELIVREREYLLKEMKELGIAVIGTPASNFIFFEAEEDLAERFLEQGVLIRSCDNYRGLRKGYYRIGVRTPEENRALMEIWKQLKK